MFSNIRLKPFVKANPPRKQNTRATASQMNAYKDVLPDALLELWQKHGFGFYGKTQFRLLNPALWQPTLDQWILSKDDGAPRVPIAMTAFGALLYYRKLEDATGQPVEDIAMLDPVTRSGDILSYDLVDFFNTDMTDREFKSDLMKGSLLVSAIQECGPLKQSEIYSIDQMMLNMEMLKIETVEALGFFAGLRNQIDVAAMPDATPPETLLAAIPAKYADKFPETDDNEDDLIGLYASVHLDVWHKLLRLTSNGTYRLLFWKVHHKLGTQSEFRYYEGRYKRYIDKKTTETSLRLDIKLDSNSLGSDSNDDALAVVRSNGNIFLLQEIEFEDIATEIGSSGSFERDDVVFEKTRLNDPLPQDIATGDSGIKTQDLPVSLRAMIQGEPLKATIIDVLEGQEGESTYVKLNLGTNDGLRMNMPMVSPKDSPKKLKGWVWVMDETNCQVGLSYNEDDPSHPEVGDVLVTRAD